METIKQIFEQLQSTNSKSTKEAILRQHKGNAELREAIHFLLNPFITTGLSAKKIDKQVSTSRLHLASGQEAMEYLKKFNTGTDLVIAAIQQFISTQPSDMHDFYKGLFTKSIKLGLGASTANKVFGKGFVPQFEVMLADKYFDHADKVEGKDFTITLKLDGIRCVAIKHDNSVKLFSRQGQLIEGLHEIEKEIMEHPLEQFVLDGELLIADVTGLSSKEQYKATMKIVRKDGDKTGIAYRAFDLLLYNGFVQQNTMVAYSDRRKELDARFNGLQYIQVLPVLYSGNDTTQIIKWLDKVRADGEEGIMININDAPYEFKRTRNLLKVKVMQDCDLEIIGFEEGSGRLAGTLGRLNVDYKGNVLGVGSGFTDEQRREFWDNQDELLGRVVQVQYFEESQDKDGNVSLRFPVFKCLREVGKDVSYA